MSTHTRKENNDIKDVLEEIELVDLPKLSDLFKKNWPYASQAWFFLNKIIEWTKSIPDYPVTVLSPREDWKELGTFIVITNEFNYTVYLFTLEDNPEYVKYFMTALATSNKINWSGAHVIDVHEKLLPFFMNIVVPIVNKPINKSWEGFFWYLKKESATDLTSIPSDIYLAPLTVNCVTFLNSTWPEMHKFPNSERFIQTLLERNESLGVYSRTNDELRAWTTINDFDCIGLLQTLPKYRRNGYASLLIKQIASNRAKRDFSTIACVIQSNAPANTVMQKIGFQLIHSQRCIIFEKINNQNGNEINE